MLSGEMTPSFSESPVVDAEGAPPEGESVPSGAGAIRTRINYKVIHEKKANKIIPWVGGAGGSCTVGA